MAGINVCDIPKVQDFINILKSKNITVHNYDSIEIFYYSPKIFVLNKLEDTIIIDTADDAILYTHYGIGYMLTDNQLYRAIYCKYNTYGWDSVMINFDEPDKIEINDKIYENKGFANMLSMIIDHAVAIRKNFNYLLRDIHGESTDEDFAICFNEYSPSMQRKYKLYHDDDILELKLYNLLITYEYKYNEVKIFLYFDEDDCYEKKNAKKSKFICSAIFII